MFEIVAEHKYCKCIRRLQGESIAQIYKDNDMSYDYWTVLTIERIDD